MSDQLSEHLTLDDADRILLDFAGKHIRPVGEYMEKLKLIAYAYEEGFRNGQITERESHD